MDGNSQRKPELGMYALVARLGFPKSYQGKIMLVAFLGTHAPLLALSLYLMLGSPLGTWGAMRVFALLLLATLVGTTITLLALRALLAPVGLTSSSLKRYLNEGTLPASCRSASRTRRAA